MDKEDAVYIHICVCVCIYKYTECNVTMLFAATWINLKIILLTEVNQTEKGKYTTYHSYVESKKLYKLPYLQNGDRLTDIENKLIVTIKERGEGKDKLRVWD